MGTKVDCKSYIPGYNNNYCHKSMRDLNEDSSSSSWPHYSRFMSSAVTNGFPSYGKDAMKQKMLEHDMIFKNQVYELHRLYRIQREMMEELKRKELYRVQPSLISNLRSQIQSQDPRRHMAGFTLINPRVEIKNSPMSCTKEYNIVQPSKESGPLESRPLKVRKRLFDLQLPADEYIDTEESEKKLSDHGIVNLADLNEPVEIEEAMSLSTVAFHDHNSINRVKKCENGDGPLVKSSLNERGWLCHPYEAGFGKSNLSSLTHDLHKEKMSIISHPAPGIMFGSSGSVTSWMNPMNISNLQTLVQLEEKCIVNGSSNLNPIFRGEVSARNGFYQGSASKSNKDTNVHSGSHRFWNSSKPVIDINLNEDEEHPRTLPWLTDLNQCSSDCGIMSTTKTKAQSVEKTIFQKQIVRSSSEKRSGAMEIDINLECQPSEEEIEIPADELIIEKEVKKQRGYIDLNTCASDFEEENDLSVKIASGIDLDLEASVEDETIKASFHMLQIEKNVIQNAAETMVTISSSRPDIVSDNNATLTKSITWFVGAVSDELDKDPFPVEEIDDFEEMTLRIPETKGADCFPVPFVPEAVGPSTSRARVRRGQSRRGRQRKDFQRDILPGLVSLSRHEVTEDIQTFGGLMQATGHHWVSGLARRNGGGRSRRRAVSERASMSERVSDVSCLNNRACQAPMVGQIGNKGVEGGDLEDQRLTGWGKRTRRPRRQRFPAGSSNPPAAVLI